MAIDGAGRVCGEAGAPLPDSRRAGRRVEQDARDWWQATCACLRALTATVDPARICAIAVDGTSGTIVCSRSDGRVARPALMYDDARARSQARAIAAAAPPDSAAQGTGSALAKLLWMRDHGGSGEWRALSPADWLGGNLTGHFDASDWNNALKFGFDPRTLDWPEWFDGLGVPRARLPARVLAPGETLGAVTTAAAAATGLAPGTTVAAGTTDGVAGFLAAGALRPGEGVSSLGSTLVLKMLSDAPLFDARHGVYSHRLGRRWLAGGASNTGGAALARYFSAAAITRLSGLIEPDLPTGLELYPLPAPGERFPRNDPAQQPVFDPRPAEPHRFLQAMLEGVARIEAEGYELLTRLGAPPLVAVRTVGAGATNPAWRRIRERALGVPVLDALSTNPAYGAAVLATGRAV